MVEIEKVIPDLYAHAEKVVQEQGERECCGLAVVTKGKLKYVECNNIAPPASEAGGNLMFQIDPKDWARAEDMGTIVAICHSHVYEPPTPSDADRVMCEKHGIPWLIVNYPTGSWTRTDPTGYQAPFEGRQFAHGVLDCYTIIHDYYERSYGIVLPPQERDAEWWLKGQNIYEERFGDAGFVKVGDGDHADIREGDVLLMQISSAVTNHAAIYLGDGMILQHLMGSLSSKYPYGGYWKKATTHVLRHKDKL